MSEKNYENYGKCDECNHENTGPNWCRSCNSKRFQQNFENWTSGNDNIDKFIQDTQSSADNHYKVLEWIPYDRFYDTEYIASGGFGKVYKTKWTDGHIHNWDNENKIWKRHNQDKFMALKRLYNSKDITLEFINEITSHHKVDNVRIIGFYGITRDPVENDYIMVLDYAENGNLRNYLEKNKLDWVTKIRGLYFIADGLCTIHEKELIHRDLHPGNILINSQNQPRITDMGLCKPADHNKEDDAYGVLPYVAPEILALRGQDYTKAADIYGFGIIMYEVFSELFPYHDMSHENLAIKICQGLRPEFNIKVPQLIVDLIYKCLDANPLIRPTAKEIKDTLDKWRGKPRELTKQIKAADKYNMNLSTSASLCETTHPNATYTSILLNVNDCKQYESMMSMEISECLDANPLNRPTAKEIKDTLTLSKRRGKKTELMKQIKKNKNLSATHTSILLSDCKQYKGVKSMEISEYLDADPINRPAAKKQTELMKQIKGADKFNKKNNNLLASSYETHSKTTYGTSRLLSCNHIQYKNIISMEISGSLQIDTPQ